MSDFLMPDVYVGQTVLWYADVTGNCSPYAAIVTETSHDCICLTAFGSGYYNGSPVSGVRHKLDPKAQKEGNRDVGVWDHTDYTKKIEQYKKASK